MKAARIHRFGGPEVIVIDDLDVPVPAAGEVLVRVDAAGVGPWDALIRSGRSVVDQPLPLTLGSDLCGTVVGVGDAHSGFAPGERVFGSTNAQFVGAYAEFAVASAEKLAPAPRSVDAVTSAGLPVAAVTAWQMLERVHAGAGQTVVVHGAGGSVGRLAVQLAHRRGARVIATSRNADVMPLADLGAEAVVDLDGEDLVRTVRAADAVLDTVGSTTHARSFEILRRGGSLVSIVTPPDADVARSHGVDASFLLVDVRGDDLRRIAAWIDDGSLQFTLGRVLPLERAREAHELLDGLRPRPPGKIVLATGFHS